MSADDEFRSEIEGALRDLVPADSRFWFTRLPVMPVVREVELKVGNATIHIGACRLIEQSSIVTPLDTALKRAVPTLKHITWCFTEV